jgi:uncharacterized membrane protein
VTPAVWSARVVSRLRRFLRQHGWEALTVAAGFVVYAGYALSRHAQYLTAGYDLGIFDQAVRAYSHFQAPIAPLKGIGYSVLGDHFHPILVALVPLYWVWSDPRVLLLAQAALIAISAIPLMRFAERRFGRPSALAVGAAYVFSWPLQGAVDFDFHEIAFAIPLLALIIDACDRRATRTVVLACLGLLLVREDMGAVVAMVGVLLAIRREETPPSGTRFGWLRTERALGAALLGAGVVTFWWATNVFIPAFAPTGTFAYWDYTALGPTLPSALKYSVTHPLSVARLFVTPAVKLHTLGLLFMPTLFAALASPYLLLAVPVLAERMLNSRSYLWTTEFHYSAVTAPIIAMAAVDGIGRVAAFVRRRRRRTETDAAFRSGLSWPVRIWIVWLIGTVGLGIATDQATYPLKRLVTGAALAQTSRASEIDDVLTQLPRGVCVEADDRIAPHLTSRWLVTLPNRSEGLATWEVIDLSQVTTGWQAPPPDIAVADAVARGFRQVLRDGPIVLMSRDGAVDPRCTVG